MIGNELESSSTSSFTMPTTYLQKNITNYLTPKVEAIKRLPSIHLFKFNQTNSGFLTIYF